MHELSLMSNMMRTAEHALSQQAAADERPIKLVLEVGELTGAVFSLLEDAYAALSKGTAFEACELELCDVPGQASCTACGHVFPARIYDFTCPVCSCHEVGYVSGKDIIIKEIVLERADKPEDEET